MSKTFVEAIKIIDEKLNQKGIKWALVGSTNLALQGMNVTPRDLDILINYPNLEAVKFIFLDYNPSKIKELKPFIKGQQAWEVRAIINNTEVQFFSEKNGEYARKLHANRLITIKLNNINIPCFSLKDEAQIYAETNRKDKAEIINKFLKQSG